MIDKIKDLIAGKTTFLNERSNQWPTVRKNHLLIQPFCQVCGTQDSLEVHHMLPFCLDKSKELDPTNLITLCESGGKGICCHLFFGHLGSWKKYNPNVLVDVVLWSVKLINALTNDSKVNLTIQDSQKDSPQP